MYKRENFKKIEETEKRYFDEIIFLFEKNKSPFIERLNSKNEIRKDWIDIFKKSAREGYDKSSELDLGAERVIHNIFGNYKSFLVNSCPIGSDLMFETHDCYIHIEVKTATDSNTADFKGKIQISQNQTSYSANKNKSGKNYSFKASLPKKYANNKLCLTYVIQIIHNNEEEKPKIIFLYSIPNGTLYKTYGNCINAGKGESSLNIFNSRKDVRFLYRDAKRFENLKDKPSRIKILFPSKINQETLKKYLGVNEL